MVGKINKQIKPTTIIILVETPHMSHPKDLPYTSGILKSASMSMMAMGNVPIPPGVSIMANVAATSTAQAAPKPR